MQQLFLNQIYPDYQTDDKTSVSNFLDDAGDSIDYYWNVRNFKQVGMNAEVAGTPVQNMVCIIFYLQMEIIVVQIDKHKQKCQKHIQHTGGNRETNLAVCRVEFESSKNQFNWEKTKQNLLI